MFNDRATELISQERRVYRHKRCQLKLEEVCYRGNTIRNSIKSRTFKLKISRNLPRKESASIARSVCACVRGARACVYTSYIWAKKYIHVN